jgi:Ca2+-binding EF-hand superfamily protein
MPITEEELKHFKELCNKYFDKYDTNKNGVIEFSELKPLLVDVAMEAGTGVPSDDDVRGVFNDADTDNNKVISREEFVELFKIIYVMKNKLFDNN